MTEMQIFKGPRQIVLDTSPFYETILVLMHSSQDDTLQSIGQQLGQ
jgi:hypothetical protein